MAGTAFTSLDAYVGRYVVGATNEAAVLLAAEVSVVRDFCKWTHIWKETLADITSVAEQQAYTLTPGTTYSDVPEVIGLDSVFYKENGADDDQYFPLGITSREFLDEYDKTWPFRSSAPVPNQCFFWEMDGKLYLIDKPTTGSTDGIVARVILQPALNASTYPPYIHSKYAEVLAKGIAGEMMQMTNKRWSNPELGEFYHNKYLAERSNAQQEVDRGNAKIVDYHVIPELAFTGGSKNRSRSSGF